MTIFHSRYTGIIVAILSLYLSIPAFADSGSICDVNKYAWSENAGWMNFNPDHGGIAIHDNYLSGYAWSENIGWIKLGADSGGPYANTTAADWGVNLDAGGMLSGYGWSENAGWIKLNPTHGGITIDGSGWLNGYAWSENIGWIHFRKASMGYGVLAVPDESEQAGLTGQPDGGGGGGGGCFIRTAR